MIASARNNAILSLVAFIVVGVFLLTRVNEDQAKRQRDAFHVVTDEDNKNTA